MQILDSQKLLGDRKACLHSCQEPVLGEVTIWKLPSWERCARQVSGASDYRDYNGTVWLRGLSVPGVFSPSKISPSKQPPGSLGIKEVLSLRSRRKDEEQRGIKCLAESLPAEPELLRALCSVSQPRAPVSLPAPAEARLWLWPFPPFPAFHTFPGQCFPALGLHPHADSELRLSGGICFRFLSSVLQLAMRRRQS